MILKDGSAYRSDHRKRVTRVRARVRLNANVCVYHLSREKVKKKKKDQDQLLRLRDVILFIPRLRLRTTSRDATSQDYLKMADASSSDTTSDCCNECFSDITSEKSEFVVVGRKPCPSHRRSKRNFLQKLLIREVSRP